jgi:hypothetical protein
MLNATPGVHKESGLKDVPVEFLIDRNEKQLRATSTAPFATSAASVQIHVTSTD